MYVCNNFVYFAQLVVFKEFLFFHYTITGNQPTSKGSTSGTDHKQASLVDSKLVQAQNPYNLEVGSVVHFDDPLKFGEIKWIGIMPGFGEVVQAGLKMVSL